MDTGFSKREDPGMNRRQFTREFNQEAVRMLIIEGLGAKEVSAQLGVARNLLYR
ncbi:MAG: hypothetical protein MK240_11440 [Opitutales bacterium]|nr:hypothetical protein [Opitutales bacterium]